MSTSSLPGDLPVPPRVAKPNEPPPPRFSRVNLIESALNVIKLRLPGALKYRDLAIRAVAAACKLVGGVDKARPRGDFDDQVVSAFGEAFNNCAIHSYQGLPLGDLEIEIDVAPRFITIRVSDFGNSFDLGAVPTPDLDGLPESGLGLFIIRSFMDEVDYRPGNPNVFTMTKRVSP